MEDQQVIDHIFEVYKKMYIDVSLGSNLEKHLEDTKTAISDINYKIENAKSKGLKTDSWEVIKNHFYELIYLIGEKT